MAGKSDTIELTWKRLQTIEPGLSDRQAKHIVASTKKAFINGKLAEYSGTDSITIKRPSDLGEEPAVVVLTTEIDAIVAALSYDPGTDEFFVPDDDEDADDDDIVTASQKAAAHRHNDGAEGKKTGQT